jgi:hypothetical protein
LIGILDTVQDYYRQLSCAEIQLKRDLKIRYLGLAAIEKLRAEQQSRLNMVGATEASGKLFYMQANGRRRKNFMKTMQASSMYLMFLIISATILANQHPEM